MPARHNRSDRMLNLYAVEQDHIVPVEPGTETPDHVVWVDLVHPTLEEEKQVERFLGLGIPTREEMAEIEVSSRLYRENDAIYMTATLLQQAEGQLPVTCPVTFILTKRRVVTVRYSEPGVFRRFVTQVGKSDFNLKDGETVFAALIEAIIDRTADILERVAADVDGLSRDIFRKEETGDAISRDYKAVISRIGRSGDLNSRVRESLVSVGRLVNFLSAECGTTYPLLRERTETMAADIRSLSDHSSYLAGTIVFLLDATLGLINIEQNAIIKIVSVVSVLIMPPTLVGTVYGMNFEYMPELNWRIGYPLALVAMVISGLLPYWYFRRKRWL